jgi:hypothetical protein
MACITVNPAEINILASGNRYCPGELRIKFKIAGSKIDCLRSEGKFISVPMHSKMVSGTRKIRFSGVKFLNWFIIGLNRLFLLQY